MSEQNYLTPGYFEQIYARDPDPWRFATSDYEREKYAATIAALPPGRFGRAFEVGCSIGILTRQLTACCDAIVAVDVADAALRQAEQICADLPGVRFANMAVPQDWPEGRFDLILFSEVLYYLGIPGIAAAARKTLESLSPGGTVVLVNWHGPTDGACTGDEAAELFITGCRPRLTPTLQDRAEKYRLDVLR
ncbi:MAG: class I SAM-dependent methyltransferase [Acetobacteraceae bacterium]